MQITVAQTAGFCFGVDRAIRLIFELLEKGENVCTLGPIIHNPQMVEELKQRGVTIVESPEDAPVDTKLVIRTHGVGPDTMETLHRQATLFADATCPYVKKIHTIVKKACENGDTILIAGDRNHPEVLGIMGYCGNQAHVFQDDAELESLLLRLSLPGDAAVTVVAQTTYSLMKWNKSVKKIKLMYTNARVFDTICKATQERQEEALLLARKNDIMLIIGGRHSSNTAKLKTLCEAFCTTYLIETAEELPKAELIGCKSIGVTAGASTPASIIKEVLETMTEMQNEQTGTMNIPDEIKAEEEKAAKSFDEMSFSEALEESFKNLNSDQKVRGLVVRITPNEVQVDIGRKHAGYVPLDELTSDPNAKPEDIVKVGDEIDLIIMRTNDQEGTVMLSKRRFDAIQGWEDVIKAQEDQSILSGVVTEVIKGGVLAVTNGVRVFIPASQATASRGDALEDLLRQPVKFRIIEVNRQRRRAVGSIRSVARELRKEAEDAFWSKVEAGQTYTGKVKSLTSYGAFVDLGGVDGMVHISELSWSRIKHPSEVVNVGDVVEVYVKGINAEKKEISLGYKKTEDNPWEILKRDYPVGTVTQVKVVGMTTFGAFAQIIPGIDGLIHNSQIATHHVAKPQDELKLDQLVTVKVTEINLEKKRVSLSIRALLEPEQAETGESTPAVATELPQAVSGDVATVEQEAPAAE